MALAHTSGTISLLPGYTITEEVYRGRRRIVYRASRDRDGTRVIVKTLLDGSGGHGDPRPGIRAHPEPRPRRRPARDRPGTQRRSGRAGAGGRGAAAPQDVDSRRRDGPCHLLPARGPARRGPPGPAPPQGHPQGHQSQQHPGRSPDRPADADRLQHRLADAGRASGAAPPERARGNHRVPVARADRQDEPRHRLSHRLLFPGRDVLRDADRAPALRVRRPARGDSRPHRENTPVPARPPAGDSAPPLRHGDEAPGEGRGGAVPERASGSRRTSPGGRRSGTPAGSSARWRPAGATSAIASWFPSDSTAASGNSPN